VRGSGQNDVLQALRRNWAQSGGLQASSKETKAFEAKLGVRATNPAGTVDTDKQ